MKMQNRITGQGCPAYGLRTGTSPVPTETLPPPQVPPANLKVCTPVSLQSDSVQESLRLQKVRVGWEPTLRGLETARQVGHPKAGLHAMTLKVFSVLASGLLESKEFFACPDDLPEDDQPKDHI